MNETTYKANLPNTGPRFSIGREPASKSGLIPKANMFSPGGARRSHVLNTNAVQKGKTMKRANKILFGTLLAIVGLTLAAHGQSTKGIASVIPAYYDGNLFNIQFVEFSAAAEQKLLAHNGSLNFIYQSDPGLPGGQPFISVIDAIPTDGFNPVWEEVQITFTAGHAPHQLFSDDEVLAAAAAGEITLDFTGEVYWCPIVAH